MRWRVALFALLLVAAPIGSAVAAPAKARIAYLGTSPGSDPVEDRRWALFTEALRQRGWVEGQNLTTTAGASKGLDARYRELAADFVKQRPDVIVALGPQAVRALAERSGGIPIVMIGVPDPVAEGFVASLARPGGNITGVSA